MYRVSPVYQDPRWGTVDLVEGIFATEKEMTKRVADLERAVVKRDVGEKE